MPDLLLATLLLLPSLLIARFSVGGNKTGYFFLYAWVAGGVIGGLFGPAWLLYAAVFFAATAFAFRERLRVNDWWKQKLRKKSEPD